MIAVLLDTNIYDLLARDGTLCDCMRRLIAAEALKIIVTRTVAEELEKSPFGGVPDLFPYEYTGNTVARADIMCAGDSVGDGAVYDEHRGQSTKHNDAFIADAAGWHADWLVSEDERLRKRAGAIKMRAQPMSYAEFGAALAQLSDAAAH